MPNCLVCGADKKRENMHIIVLTEAEQKLLSEPLAEYLYCQPCWGILSNPVTAPALISGIARHHLQQAGVSQSNQLADKFRQDLADRATTRRS